MFTGLIEDVGTVEVGRRRTPTAPGCGSRRRSPREIGLGDSVAVNGVCLTATAVDDGGFETEAMNQTLEVTALGALDAGAAVNLELAMKASDRLGGHIVQGHVDGVGEVVSIEEDGFARRLRVELPDRAAALRRRQGLDHARRRQPDGRGAGRGLGRGLPDPRDPGADEPRRGRGGDEAERRVRRGRQVRGAIDGTIRRKGASVSQMTETPEDRRGSRGGRRARSRRSRRRSRRSAAAGWSSSATARTARTRATW